MLLKDGVRAHIVSDQVAFDNKPLVEEMTRKGHTRPEFRAVVVPLALVHAIADRTPDVVAQVDNDEDED